MPAVLAGLADGGWLAVVAALAVLVAAGTLLAYRRSRRGTAHLMTAVDNMSQGLCMFDAGQRLVMCNAGYLHMYGLSPDVVRPGCTVRDLLQQRINSGTFTGDPEEYIARLMATL